MHSVFKKYIFTTFVAIAALASSYMAIYSYFDYIGLNTLQKPFQMLYEYQNKKARLSDASVVFVGDSSLGNAIDADYFSQLSGYDTGNFALTGKFGYLGSLKMIKSIDSKNLKTVFVFQTTDMMTRDIALDYNTIRLFKSSNFSGINLSIFNISTFDLFMQQIDALFHGKPIYRISIENDYIKQGARLENLDNYDVLRPEKIVKDKTHYLKDIAQYCFENNLQCVYVHGPVAAKICNGSPLYFEQAAKNIAETHIPLEASTPLCIPPEELGDSIDHVAPQYKKKYTKKYYDLLKSYL